MSAHLNITGMQRNGVTNQITVDREPDTCPICHRTGTPSPLAGAPGWLTPEQLRLQRPYRCASQACEEIFVAVWEGDASRPGPYLLVSTYPVRGKPTPFAQVITDTSPNFVAIYNQAEEAEHMSLDLVCGPGYRKALEFLIKDYLIKQGADAEETIKKKFLGAAIKDYINSSRIKTAAERAVWLGNDETHYERLWVGKDREDLKRLILLTVHWIEDEKATEEFAKEMPESRPSTVIPPA